MRQFLTVAGHRNYIPASQGVQRDEVANNYGTSARPKRLTINGPA